ncbi:hypothetical protein FK535_24710 [Mycolicibacterium sp. 018/SC-01/001]|uniref:hypothetical protein n=1 Tax=Mycolicibacterium sp. 018/SC-01/001 TaxID=2592069 RepID=UPI00117FD2F3|nr:hypothetical protein [Mycolicibacterium sp. 018/SC-01/001]TRW78566.1 hypothetical protein FK535_24710 [Mycolicibacterium sp. 018/SC-01/001]
MLTVSVFTASEFTASVLEGLAGTSAVASSAVVVAVATGIDPDDESVWVLDVVVSAPDSPSSAGGSITGTSSGDSVSGTEGGESTVLSVDVSGSEDGGAASSVRPDSPDSSEWPGSVAVVSVCDGDDESDAGSRDDACSDRSVTEGLSRLLESTDFAAPSSAYATAPPPKTTSIDEIAPPAAMSRHAGTG